MHGDMKLWTPVREAPEVKVIISFVGRPPPPNMIYAEEATARCAQALAAKVPGCS